MAFHPYPQLIRAFCNRHRCGPPPPLTAASPWPWVAHPVSGLPRATPRPVRTRCRCGSGCRCLSLAARDLSPVRSTKSTPSHHQDAPTDRGRAVSGTLSLPSAGVLFTIPSRYSALSVVHGIQPWDVVTPASDGIARAPPYSRSRPRAAPLPPTGLSPALAARSSGVRLKVRFVTRPGLPSGPQGGRTTPREHRPTGHSARGV